MPWRAVLLAEGGNMPDFHPLGLEGEKGEMITVMKMGIKNFYDSVISTFSASYARKTYYRDIEEVGRGIEKLKDFIKTQGIPHDISREFGKITSNVNNYLLNVSLYLLPQNKEINNKISDIIKDIDDIKLELLRK